MQSMCKSKGFAMQVSLNQPTGPIQTYSCNVHMSVCLPVSDVAKHPLPEVVETSGQRAYH